VCVIVCVCACACVCVCAVYVCCVRVHSCVCTSEYVRMRVPACASCLSECRVCSDGWMDG